MSTAAADRPYVVIIGGGKVGFYLAKHLIERDYELTLVEKNATRAEWIEHQLGSVSIMVGDGDEMAFLSTTGIERAGVFIACTGDDEDNLVACQLAKGKFGVGRTIARVNNPVNVNVFTALGVDVPVSATDLLMGLIESEISTSDAVRGIAVKASGANLIDVALPDLSSLVGKTVGDVTLPPGDAIVCIVRDAEPVIPGPAEVIRARDELIVYSRRLDIAAVRDSLTA
ncbi:MAG: NAD-binding protein [Candidatus Dormibacteraeota bacterium]|nr:NAD-binding protein [Candidatus Dormibacteraeota bacterium]